MYIVFLMGLVAAVMAMAGYRTASFFAALITTVALAALLFHHMTDKLPISL